jgi:hypothetical protein
MAVDTSALEQGLYKRQARKPARVVRPAGSPASPSTAARPLTSGELSELSEQSVVVSALRRARIHFFAVPNGHVRSKRQHIQAKHEGVSAGVPDLIIVTPPPGRPDLVATALEMKRADAKPSDLREDQVKWLAILASCKWAAVVGLGAADALTKLRNLGYQV